MGYVYTDTPSILLWCNDVGIISGNTSRFVKSHKTHVSSFIHAYELMLGLHVFRLRSGRSHHYTIAPVFFAAMQWLGERLFFAAMQWLGERLFFAAMQWLGEHVSERN